MDSIGSIDGPTHLKVVQENERLKEENERLKQHVNAASISLTLMQDTLDEKEAENERLKEMLGPLADHICLLCGKSEPCMTDEESIAEGGPGAPCTFDPTPKELWEDNKRLRKENERLKALLAEARDDLDEWIGNEYPEEVLGYPVMQRRYDRDMDIVRRISAELERGE